MASEVWSPRTIVDYTVHVVRGFTISAKWIEMYKWENQKYFPKSKWIYLKETIPTNNPLDYDFDIPCFCFDVYNAINMARRVQ